MSFICIIIKNHFHINGFAHSLTLKLRISGTRKWPINSANLYQLDILKYCLEAQPPLSRTSGLETQMQCLQKMLQELKAVVTAL